MSSKTILDDRRRRAAKALPGVARRSLLTCALLLAAGCASAPPAASAADVHVMISGGFTQPYKTLTPKFEAMRGDRLITVNGPSMGATPEAIPARLARGEPADVVILAREGLDLLVEKGAVVRGSEVDLVRSRVAIAVKQGHPKLDISTVEGLKNALIAAKSIAYSDSASGVYVSTQLFKRLGIEDQVKSKARMIPGTPVGLSVANGDAEIGFQQLSELLPVPGITVVGPIPEEVQKVTLFSAGIVKNAQSPVEAKALIDFLASPAARPAIESAGLEQASRSATR